MAQTSHQFQRKPPYSIPNRHLVRASACTVIQPIQICRMAEVMSREDLRMDLEVLEWMHDGFKMFEGRGGCEGWQICLGAPRRTPPVPETRNRHMLCRQVCQQHSPGNSTTTQNEPVIDVQRLPGSVAEGYFRAAGKPSCLTER